MIRRGGASDRRGKRRAHDRRILSGDVFDWMGDIFMTFDKSAMCYSTVAGSFTQEPVFHDVDQGSEEWAKLRTGLLTASEFKLILTPGTLKAANNDKTRAHVYEIMAQRITGHTEESFYSDDMMRGTRDEVFARAKYEETSGIEVREVGFITRPFARDDIVMSLGFSPDGLVGNDGMIECKSRRQKYQIETALSVARGVPCPSEYMLQIQGGMLIAGRQWCDFISYSGGLPMVTGRVYADSEIQGKILDAAFGFETTIGALMGEYHNAVESHGWPMTDRFEEPEGMNFDDE